MSETPAGLTPEETHAVILDVLNRAAAAHGIHEADDLGGVRDEQWPEWYTANMVDTLRQNGYALVGPRPPLTPPPLSPPA